MPSNEQHAAFIALMKQGSATINAKLNLRSEPTTKGAVTAVAAANSVLQFDAEITNGEAINNNAVWYRTVNNQYFWSGGVKAIETVRPPVPVFKIMIPPSPPSLDTPISKSQCLECSSWMNDQFGDKCAAAVEGSPFDKDLLYALACQETAYVWNNWIKDHSADEVLARCVFDASGDVNGTRSVFPKNTAAFIEKFGKEKADLLIAEANLTRKWRGYEPKQWVYAGYGIFQYDLQFVLTDPQFFLEKQWYSIDKCIEKVMKELNSKWAAHPKDIFNTVRSYNGSGKAAQQYAINVFQFLKWIRENA